jgi:Pyruvate/2-oxoacid:ferredoxin oxidoreductase delta subunit
MKRKIITIDDTKCTGCGQCIPDCPEGALQLIEGKARLVSDLFCDGLGACIGTCPEGAISVIERDAAPYDERAVMATIAKQGPATIKAHLEHLVGHGQRDFYNQAVEYLIEQTIPIPDHDNSGVMQSKKPAAVASSEPPAERPGKGAGPSQAPAACPPGPDHKHPFAEWPVQLALLNPAAPFFENADLLISADCAPFAYAGFHTDLLAGRILIIFCPKLDADIEGYIDKLAELFRIHTIRSVTIARMEVPCCGGVRYVVEKAMERAGAKIPLTERTVMINGEIR